MPRIALIHAVTVAMAPVHDAFGQLWPEAECVDILDTSVKFFAEEPNAAAIFLKNGKPYQAGDRLDAGPAAQRPALPDQGRLRRGVSARPRIRR